MAKDARPRPNPMGMGEWIAYALAGLATLAAYGYWAATLISAKGEIPVHFGPDGQPDRWGGTGEAWIIFGVLLASSLLILGLVHIPQISNIPVEPRTNAGWQKIYTATRVLMIGMAISLAAMAVGIARATTSAGVGAFMYIGLILMLVVIVVAIAAMVKIGRADRQG